MIYSYMVENELVNIEIKRALKVKGFEFDHFYEIGIGQRKNGNYIVISIFNPRFCFEQEKLFDVLDKAQDAVEFYHNNKIKKAKEIFDKIHAYHTSNTAWEEALAFAELNRQLQLNAASNPPVNITRISVPASNVKLHECRFCGRQKERLPCMNTRDCEDTTDKICQAALLVQGGGEYTWRSNLSHSLYNCKQLPLIHEFKQQIANHDMRFVDLAAKCLRKEQHSL